MKKRLTSKEAKTLIKLSVDDLVDEFINFRFKRLEKNLGWAIAHIYVKPSKDGTIIRIDLLPL